MFILSLAFESLLKGRENIQRALEKEILNNPEVGDVIQGTGGVRKFRLADPNKPKGKRGGLRIFFLDLPHVERTHLLWILKKNENDNLSDEEKDMIREIVRRIKIEAK